MQTSAKIVLDSLSPDGARLTTMQLVYPRFIHSEFMTHRVFSRNAASSRAIPVAKMIEQVRNDPAMPCHWGANQPGMQARAEVTDIMEATAKWKRAAVATAAIAEEMAMIGLHKQVANRILEPFQWMHTIVTATEWDNFFQLRLHPDADPNIFALAKEMLIVLKASTPVERLFHAPYVDDAYAMFDRKQAMLSAARCARVSYLNHDGSAPDADKDMALAIRLEESGHWSPFEHAAVTDDPWAQNANFRGWHSFRNYMGK